MNETLFFDKAYEAKTARKWSRQSVKLEAVSLRFGTEPPYEWREREVYVAGDIGYYERLSDDWQTNVWIIAHLPTGYQVGPEFSTKEDALLFVYLVRDLDWSFTKPNRDYPNEFRERVREACIQAEASFVPLSVADSYEAGAAI